MIEVNCVQGDKGGYVCGGFRDFLVGAGKSGNFSRN